MYSAMHEYSATFDGRRGVVSRVETRDTSGYPNSKTTLGTIELTGIENRGESWAATFGREADRYFDAIEAYDTATERAVRDGVDATVFSPRLKSEQRHEVRETCSRFTSPHGRLRQKRTTLKFRQGRDHRFSNSGK